MSFSGSECIPCLPGSAPNQAVDDCTDGFCPPSNSLCESCKPGTYSSFGETCDWCYSDSSSSEAGSAICGCNTGFSFDTTGTACVGTAGFSGADGSSVTKASCEDSLGTCALGARCIETTTGASSIADDASACDAVTYLTIVSMCEKRLTKASDDSQDDSGGTRLLLYLWAMLWKIKFITDMIYNNWL